MVVKLAIVIAILAAAGIGVALILRSRRDTRPVEPPPPMTAPRASKRDVAVAALGVGGQLIDTIGSALSARGRADA